ncbi:bifunctional diaminohydroxyphosphoribosylaminopyrimidine deaminase/5-amino-6-(5-phosphoribosylamino)uracil reductase RibD [Alkalicoccus daliensis]|uniref:Riboflavin biosynthesis protein RibD n=1 Tax=Alkalicoccus daliensis TaxID=745820 RepID=A0A1H0B0C7_9BACI|nr:bifunctional diaminohydroxyphosphoribosylaminopyrimidine deaminase/5-amino-6-(5-phosphoribosylamino)uracil reductase RibD [Alkalicoccus daliensis]SDN38753.1 diaminohydroxyphosphoribosylaminopyrimidine deaminase / 5-amino-6-(5-phosphoribosylamino)uracil reductase [Alkalicoccus daliensis]
MNETYMKLAIELAGAAAGQTSPNPLVGCVIVKQGEVIGMGAHLKAGEKHAERHALAMAGEKAAGAEMYVTLEPCSHTGRTPPCADAVVEAGIKKVYIGSVDPDSRVAGKGIQKLQNAGIEVVTGVMKEEADSLNRIFFHYAVNKKPYVTLKMATSIDGKIATVDGESQWITGTAARLDGHKLRHLHDAILVGIETVLADNPSLTTRLPQGGKNPLRIVLDSRLRVSKEATVIKDGGETWIFTTEQADTEKVEEIRAAGVKLTVVPGFRVPVEEVLIKLGEAEITSLLVEGGGTIHDSFLRAGILNEIVHYSAPLLIGGNSAPQAVSGQGLSRLAEVPRYNLAATEILGDDMKHVYYRKE